MARRYVFLLGWATLLALVSSGLSAAAQTASDDKSKTVAMCAVISSALERLSCYDELTRQVGKIDSESKGAEMRPDPPDSNNERSSNHLTSSANTGALGSWVRDDQVDGLDKSKIIIFSLPAESGNVGLLGKPGMRRGPSLVMRCKEHEAQLFVSFDLAVTGAEDSVPVQYRIGVRAPTKGIWSRSEDETSFGSWNTAGTALLVEQLETAADFFVRARGSTGRTSEALFKVDGIRAVAKAIQEGCPW